MSGMIGKGYIPLDTYKSERVIDSGKKSGMRSLLAGKRGTYEDTDSDFLKVCNLYFI